MARKCVYLYQGYFQVQSYFVSRRKKVQLDIDTKDEAEREGEKERERGRVRERGS